MFILDFSNGQLPLLSPDPFLGMARDHGIPEKGKSPLPGPEFVKEKGSVKSTLYTVCEKLPLSQFIKNKYEIGG